MNRMPTMLAMLVLVVGGVALAGCPGSPGGPAISSKMNTPQEPAVSPVVSADLLAREPVANTAQVKHILIGWSDLGEAYQGHLDPRAAKRSKAEAEAEVRALVNQLREGGDFDQLMKTHSEDTASAAASRVFTVTPDAQLVIEFRQLALRLNVGEFGVCQSDFGFHIIKRVG